VNIKRLVRNLRVSFSIVVLSIHDDDQVGGHTHSLGQTPGGHQHLDGAAKEQILHRLTLDVHQTLV
jgi:hypothetical protein